MILLLVGTHFKGFDRLVKTIDELAVSFEEQVVMQIGATRYIPKRCAFFRTASYQVIKDLIRKARIIITHGGSGSILDCLAAGKVPIVVPRSAIFGEAKDDHQTELAETLNREGRVIMVADLAKLSAAIHGYNSASIQVQMGGRLPVNLREYIRRLTNLEKEKAVTP